MDALSDAHGGASVDVRFAQSERHPRLVRTYWEVHGHFPHVRERVLPTADVFLIVNLGSPHVLIGMKGEHVYRDAWASGIQQSALVTGALGPTDLWGAKLSPHGSHLAFGSTSCLAGTVAELVEIMGQSGRALTGRLRDAGSFEQRCALFDDHLAASLATGIHRWRREVAWALDRMTASATVQVAELAREIGWSRKHLHAQFHDHFGHSPKTMVRVIRFERALRLIGDHENCRLAEVALRAGYYDQAQFTREFHALAGITPTAYLRSRVAGADYGFVDADG